MSWEEIVVGAAIILFILLGLWRTVLQVRIVRLFLRRIFGRYR
jgi:hypothetical protein